MLRRYSYKTGIQLWPGTKIDRGLCFAHFSCIVINNGCRIGKNCTIFQGVTIGSARGKGVPCIGDNVVICANSSIIGKVTIGNNVIIGAGTVVTKDIPDNAVAVGNPARIVSYNGPEQVALYIISNGKE